MPPVALLSPAPEAVLVAPLVVAGRSVLERQVRQARLAGAARIIVVGGVHPGAETVAAAELVTQLVDHDLVLVLAPGVVADERIVAAVCAVDGPVLATWPVAHGGVERIDAVTFAAGVAVYPGALVRRVASALGDWDLHSTLLRAALADPGIARLDLAGLDLYAPARRRVVPLGWALPTTPDEAAATTSMLLAAAQKGCLDWPARWLHPPIEDALTRLLLPTRITPNQVTLFIAALSVVAGVAFACGWLWTGLVIALVCGPLDGVDGKLARTRLEYSRYGDLEHVLDKLAEYGWYLALAGHFSAIGATGAWAVAALIVLFALAEALAGEFFRRFTGKQLDDAGPFERRFRLVSGRRNTFFWTLVPFALAGAWYSGFVAIAVYAVATFFVMQYSLYRRLADYGSQHSATIAGNFARTAYGFLPGAAQRGSDRYYSGVTAAPRKVA